MKQEVDIHEAGYKAIEKIYVKYGFTCLRIQVRPVPRIKCFLIL